MEKSFILSLSLIGGLILFPLSACAQQMMEGGMGPGGMMGGGGGYQSGYEGGQYPPYGNMEYQGPWEGLWRGPNYGNPYGLQYSPGPQYGPGSQYEPLYEQPQKPLDKEEAKQEVENYLSSIWNPNLKLGGVTDEGSYFEARIVTKKNNSLVDKILVDKNTGSMRWLYQKSWY
jgi:hypothetical protein